jgi:hypothetical protein
MCGNYGGNRGGRMNYRKVSSFDRSAGMDRSDISTLISLLRQQKAYDGFVGDAREQVNTLKEGLGRNLGEAILEARTEGLSPEQLKELKILKHLAGV